MERFVYSQKIFSAYKCRFCGCSMEITALQGRRYSLLLSIRPRAVKAEGVRPAAWYQKRYYLRIVRPSSPAGRR